MNLPENRFVKYTRDTWLVNPIYARVTPRNSQDDDGISYIEARLKSEFLRANQRWRDRLFICDFLHAEYQDGNGIENANTAKQHVELWIRQSSDNRN